MFVPLFNLRDEPLLLSFSSCQPSPLGSSLHGYTQWLIEETVTLGAWLTPNLLGTLKRNTVLRGPSAQGLEGAHYASSSL